MKDMMKFMLAIILLAPCFLVFNENDNWWVNVIGVVYIFCLAACAMGNTKHLDKWLNSVERFEESLKKG